MIKEHYTNYSSKPKSSEMKELVNDLIHRVCDTYKEYKVNFIFVHIYLCVGIRTSVCRENLRLVNGRVLSAE